MATNGYGWKLRNLALTPKYFENWWSLYNFPSVGVLRKYKLKFRFPSLNDLAYDTYVLKENFFEAQYDWLDVKGKVVIDIGLNMGDTAILFAYRGAKQVIGYEPYASQYNKALQNISLNKMNSVITPLQIAVSDKEGTIIVKEGYTDGSQVLRDEHKGIAVPKTTLAQIVEKYNPTVLKCDCEGSEYDIILSTKPKVLRKFEQMTIDYHVKGGKSLEKHLIKAGFKVSSKGNETMGMLSARRIE